MSLSVDLNTVMNQNYKQWLVSPIIGGSSLYLFDMYFQKMGSSQAFSDSKNLVLSLFLSKLFASFLDTKFVDQFGSTKVQYVSNLGLQPTINMFLYEYLYNNWQRPKYADMMTVRTDFTTKMIGLATGFGQGVSDQIIVNWLSKQTNLLNLN